MTRGDEIARKIFIVILCVVVVAALAALGFYLKRDIYRWWLL